MALKTLLFVILFLGACGGALFSPIWGVLGYVAHYSIGPERQWWHAPVSFLGIRYSLTLAALTALGMVMHWKNLRFGRRVFDRHELLALSFLAFVWLSALLGQDTVGRYAVSVDHPTVKLTKVLLFTLMLTHIVTTQRNFDRLLWTLVITSMILGMQAWNTPYSSFNRGRLERVGGPDFAEANFFAAFMVTMLWIIGAQFLRSHWKGKVICFLSGGFTANAVVLTRSRSAMVGLAAGALIALFSVPKRYRMYVAVGGVIAACGFLYLSDEQYLGRVSTIAASTEERDSSAQSRIVLAKAGLEMWRDHPMGVGPGNFYQNIGTYVPEYAGKDAHNTYIRCLTETGVFGLVAFLLVILNAFVMTFRIRAKVVNLPDEEENDIALLAFGTTCAVGCMLGCCLTISLTYVEFIWWFMLLPVCLDRVVNNMLEDHANRSTQGGQNLFV